MDIATQELTLLLLRVLNDCLGVTKDLRDNTTTDSTATFTHGVTKTRLEWDFVEKFNLESSVITWHNEFFGWWQCDGTTVWIVLFFLGMLQHVLKKQRM